MVTKKYLIEFDEQSKAVVAKVSVTTEVPSSEELSKAIDKYGNVNDALLKEAQDLFDKAQEFAKIKTLDKMR